MESESKIKTRTILYASPWLFAAACALLTLIIAVFAVNNYRRERELMNAALAQEGRTILSLVSASSRASMRRGFRLGEFSRESIQESVQQVVSNSSEHPGIVALYLVNEKGLIIAHNEENERGRKVDKETLNLLEHMQSENVPETNRIKSGGESQEAVYQVIVPFLPFGLDADMRRHMDEMGRGRMGWMMDPRQRQRNLDRLRQISGDSHYFLIAELSLEEFNQAVRKQFFQIVILSIVLFLVGVGGLLSLMMMQGLKGSQMRLRRMSAFTDVLVSSLPVGIIAAGYDGRVRTCNPSAALILNIEGEKSKGKALNEILPDVLLETMTKQSSGTEEGHWEVSLPGDGQEFRLIDCSRVEIEDPDRQHSGTILLIQDLSRLRKLETELRRRERDAEVGRMAAGVAHELRNPLSSIKGLSLLLKSKIQDSSSGSETADLLVDEVERLNRSIGELLDYARPAQLEIGTVKIDELIARALMLISSDAKAAGIDITSDYNCQDKIIEIDQDKITQVILNICLNSVQAMPEGGELKISTGIDDSRVKITISDSGVGIPRDVLKKVFEPYVTTRKEGTGLGLAMSAKIIEDHDGSIDLSSIPGQGTTVVLTLPLQRSGNSGGSFDSPV